MPFDYEADLARAVTPPPGFYLDPGMLGREREAVFGRTWQLCGRAEQLEVRGDFVCTEVAGHGVVLVHDGAAVRGFHNVCAHRAGPVAVGCGRRQSLTCGYHGWTYDLAGTLIRAPEMEQAVDFDPGSIRLREIRVERCGPLWFASFDPIAPLEQITRGIDIDPALGWVMRRDYELDANWKIYVDNYLEGYHIPMVHPELHRELDYDRYHTELDRYWSRQHAPLRPLSRNASDRRYRPEHQDGDAAYYWVFPNLMINIYQGQLQTNLVVPLCPAKTRVIFEWYAPEPPVAPEADPRWRALIDMSDQVQQQDADICETVQRNLASPGAARGRYSPRRESGVHHFHGLLHDLLRTDPTA